MVTAPLSTAREPRHHRGFRAFLGPLIGTSEVRCWASGLPRSAAEAIAQLALEHLAGWGARQRVDELDRPRELVAGEAGTREGDELVGVRDRPRPRHNER